MNVHIKLWNVLGTAACTIRDLRPYGRTNTSIKLHGVVLHSVCHIITIPTSVEPYCNTVQNIVLEVVPEDDACVEMRWTIICFKFERYFNELMCVIVGFVYVLFIYNNTW